MYAEVLNDPKAQKLSDSAFRGWVNLLCLASNYDGILEQPLENVAFSLRKSLPKTKELFRILVAAELLDELENGWKPHNWDTRQYKSDVSTERVKRFRKRREAVSETPPDTDSDTEQNQIQKKEEDSSKSPPAMLDMPTPKIPKTNGKKPKGDMPEGFEAFWAEYPRRDAKGDAVKAYREALKRAGPEILLAGARRYAAAKNGEERKYLKLPAGWLRADRWLDEPDKPNGHKEFEQFLEKDPTQDYLGGKPLEQIIAEARAAKEAAKDVH